MPVAELSLPVLFNAKAPSPKPVFATPVVLAYSASKPVAVLSLPIVFSFIAR